MNITETLIKARELISDPKHWTKKALARSEKNRPVDVFSKKACAFCMEGAIRKAEDDLWPSPAVKYVSKYTQKKYYKAAYEINDAPETTHEDVLKLFDEMIEASKTERNTK